MREVNLITLIQRLTKQCGKERADSCIAGMMLVHKDYFSLKKAIQDYLQNY